jgi:hypothetical protein
MREKLRFWGALACTVAALSSLFWAANATRAEADAIKLELNKLEPIAEGCRAYLVIENTATAQYDSLRLDLVMFQPDGIIGRRFAVQLAPVKANKRSVKLFDLAGLTCDLVGSFLINDALECKTAEGAVADCLTRMQVSSRSNVQLMK